jgi:predicted helicase
MILVRQNNKLVADNKRELKALKREFSSLEEPIIEYKSKTFYANDNARIQYVRRPEMETALDKLNWISQSKIEELDFDTITPDKNNNWINNSDNDWEGLLPVCDKLVKGGVSDRAIFEKYSTGISTNRDEWIIDFSKDTLASRMTYFIKRYDVLTSYDASIKWSRNLKQRFGVGKKESFDFDKIKKYNHRPYTPTFIYHSDLYIDEQGLTKIIFPKKNFVISLCSTTSNKEFHALAIDSLYDLHFTGDSQGVPLYLYDAEGVSRDNITNWALEQFGNHYKQIEPSSPVCYAGSSELREEYNIGDSNSSAITKEAIFHYVYAVLHNPAYRKKYELNLKREFPRIPFYDDFWQWSKWGEQLMNLHIHYETTEPYKLERKELVAKVNPKAKLKALKDIGVIVLDDNTELHGIPKQAWNYKLGNRSALEWILDQYKEKKPGDPTIAENFNTYKFADYKEQVIDLLKRVCTVSVETMKIVGEMEKLIS